MIFKMGETLPNPKCLCFLVIILSVVCGESEVVNKLCSFDKPLVASSRSLARKEENYCNCVVENAPPWGMPVLKIDCQDRQFENSLFKAEILPLETVALDVSWNKLNFVPDFVGEKLKFLTLSNNVITTLDDNNFGKVNNLEELDLSNNKLEIVPSDAFTGLHNIRKIDLTENYIKTIQSNSFSGLSNLMHLILSNNPLNETFSAKDTDLFLKLGVSTKLRIFEIEGCNLTHIDITNGVGLEQIYFSKNNFLAVPNIPRGVEFLDLSSNPIRVLTAKFLPHLFNLKILYLEDMPFLNKIDEYALYGLPRLMHLNLQGSKNLSTIHPYVFGKNVVQNNTDTVLEILNLRGTKLSTLNSSISLAFESIKTLDLGGNPLICDCKITWIKSLNIETNAQCVAPASLMGKLLSEVPEDEIECTESTSWVYTMLNCLLVLVLIILCSVAIYLIVMGIRPSRKVQLRKVGSTSPYARVTIEPNQAESPFTL